MSALKNGDQTTAPDDVIKAAVTDAWDFWLSQREVSLPELIQAATKEAVREWLDERGPELFAAAIREAARAAAIDAATQRKISPSDETPQLGLAEVRRAWDEVTKATAKKSKRVAAIVRAAWVVHVDDTQVNLYVPSSVLEKLLRPELHYVEKALYETLGVRWTVSVTSQRTEPNADRPGETSSAPLPTNPGVA
ncbi:hypothetical protein [Micromonospora sp. NPDC005707]|uniref:hypothetical protein n=1 Tax=Micromonospora sp. NPDC005707 TaxID=3157050 RepID=UPI0033CA3D47